MRNKTILIAGGSGLVGSRLQEIAEKSGYDCYILTRNPKAKNHIQWDIDKKQIDEQALPEIDYVVNLAGEGIADKKWTVEHKKVLLDSRTEPILLLSNWISGLKNPPKAFVSASGVGYYGDGGEKWQKETDKSGTNFLAYTAKIWEEATNSIKSQGIRTTILRIGIVLSVKGGALPKITMPFKMGVGSYFGNGKMYMPWIHIDDLCKMIIFTLENKEVSGVYNAVSPNPATNYELTKTAGKVIGNPHILVPAPKLAIQLAMGERYQLVFTSNRASSEKIQNTGFKFDYDNLELALEDVIGKGK
jgi:uncharacterized protein (TIGR01777 family)